MTNRTDDYSSNDRNYTRSNRDFTKSTQDFNSNWDSTRSNRDFIRSNQENTRSNPNFERNNPKFTASNPNSGTIHDNPPNTMESGESTAISLEVALNNHRSYLPKKTPFESDLGPITALPSQQQPIYVPDRKITEAKRVLKDVPGPEEKQPVNDARLNLDYNARIESFYDPRIDPDLVSPDYELSSKKHTRKFNYTLGPPKTEEKPKPTSYRNYDKENRKVEWTNLRGQNVTTSKKSSSKKELQMLQVDYSKMIDPNKLEVNLKKDSNQVEAVAKVTNQPSNRLEVELNQPMPTQQTQRRVMDIPRQILFGFIYVSEANYVGPSVNTYFTCRPFAQDDILCSRVIPWTSSPMFNFHQVCFLLK